MNIVETNPYLPEAVQLMNELSNSLETITGNSGRASFDPEDVCVPRAVFVIAYDNGEALGCGGLRPIDDNTAEVKRMYARIKHAGVGSYILTYLERKAEELGYSTIRLETRLINQNAVCFYDSRGYDRINNYGKYKDNPEAVCFEKIISQSRFAKRNENLPGS